VNYFYLPAAAAAAAAAAAVPRTDYDGPLLLQSLHQGVIMVCNYILVQQ
jgi:hypothetical protein